MSDFNVRSRPRHPGIVYHGVRDQRTALVYRDGVPFDPRPSLAFYNHSPTGFEWGYCGSGPAQLALAILLDQYEPIIALEFYQDFKARVIARLDPYVEWRMSGCDVHEALSRIVDRRIDLAGCFDRLPLTAEAV